MNATKVKELLLLAIECDTNGRILEAQNLYEEGIGELRTIISQESNEAKRKSYSDRLNDYIERAEAIKTRIHGHLRQGEILTRIAIDEDATGYNYETIFGKYMTGSTREILIEEPYMRENFQFTNLVKFFELAVSNCPYLQYISLVTKGDPKNSQQQKIYIRQIENDLKSRGIKMVVTFDDSLHDRKIVLSNGFIITLGRGLHFYKPTNPLYSLGLGDFKFRKCLKTDVTICRTKN